MILRIVFFASGFAAIAFPIYSIVTSLVDGKPFNPSDGSSIAAGIVAIVSTSLGVSKEKASVRHDRDIYSKFLSNFPHNPSIQLLKHHDFGGDYYASDLQHLLDFVRDWDRPELEFLDKRIERKRKALYEAAHALYEDFMRETIPNDGNPELRTVYPWKQRGGKRPDSVKQSAIILNNSARNFAPQYDDFVRYARKRLSMET